MNEENVRKTTMMKMWEKKLKEKKHKYAQYGDIDEKNKSLQSCNFMRCPQPYSNWFHPPQSDMQFLLQDCHALRDPAPSTGWFFDRIDQACRINTYPFSCLQLFKATKCSILQTLLTSLHAPCHALKLTVLQLNAANARTYQKAPPIGRATKSQKRHDFDNWVFLWQSKRDPAQSVTCAARIFFSGRGQELKVLA